MPQCYNPIKKPGLNTVRAKIQLEVKCIIVSFIVFVELDEDDKSSLDLLRKSENLEGRLKNNG